MPVIRSSADLRNNYNKAYELLSGRSHLYSEIDEGLNQVKKNKVKPHQQIK